MKTIKNGALTHKVYRIYAYEYDRISSYVILAYEAPVPTPSWPTAMPWQLREADGEGVIVPVCLKGMKILWNKMGQENLQFFDVFCISLLKKYSTVLKRDEQDTHLSVVI